MPNHDENDLGSLDDTGPCILIWRGIRGQVLRVFVPVGLDDRSDSTELAEVQAIYCLEHTQLRIHPVGHGLIPTPVD